MGTQVFLYLASMGLCLIKHLISPLTRQVFGESEPEESYDIHTLLLITIAARPTTSCESKVLKIIFKDQMVRS